MTCAEYERWLDDGMPNGVVSLPAQAHVAGCLRCAASHAAALELDCLLAAPVVFAPGRLTDSVMARVAAIESVRAAHAGQAVVPGALVWGEGQAWWVRAAAQPAAALAFSLAALVLWKGDAIRLHGSAWIANASGMMAHALTSGFGMPAITGIPEAFARPEVMLGFAFAIAPVLALVSAALWNWAERRV